MPMKVALGFFKNSGDWPVNTDSTTPSHLIKKGKKKKEGKIIGKKE